MLGTVVVQEEGNQAFLSSIRMRSGTRPGNRKQQSDFSPTILTEGRKAQLTNIQVQPRVNAEESVTSGEGNS